MHERMARYGMKVPCSTVHMCVGFISKLPKPAGLVLSLLRLHLDAIVNAIERLAQWAAGVLRRYMELKGIPRRTEADNSTKWPRTQPDNPTASNSS